MRLNLGCGNHPKQGYINVDKFAPADVVCDLEGVDDKLYSASQYHVGTNYHEKGKWPWDDNSVDEVLFHHSLEHMGETTDKFFHIIKELYRVCKNGAEITITVPHPRHDDFLNDPTHVRIITPMILELFSKKNNELWAETGAPNTPLALQLGVDFEITRCTACVEADYADLPPEVAKISMLRENNVIKFFTVVWKCIK